MQKFRGCSRLLDMKTQAYNFDIRIDKDYNKLYSMGLDYNGGNTIAQIEKLTVHTIC